MSKTDNTVKVEDSEKRRRSGSVGDRDWPAGYAYWRSSSRSQQYSSSIPSSTGVTPSQLPTLCTIPINTTGFQNDTALAAVDRLPNARFSRWLPKSDSLYSAVPLSALVRRPVSLEPTSTVSERVNLRKCSSWPFVACKRAVAPIFTPPEEQHDCIRRYAKAPVDRLQKVSFSSCTPKVFCRAVNSNYLTRTVALKASAENALKNPNFSAYYEDDGNEDGYEMELSPSHVSWGFNQHWESDEDIHVVPRNEESLQPYLSCPPKMSLERDAFVNDMPQKEEPLPCHHPDTFLSSPDAHSNKQSIVGSSNIQYKLQISPVRDNIAGLTRNHDKSKIWSTSYGAGATSEEEETALSCCVRPRANSDYTLAMSGWRVWNRRYSCSPNLTHYRSAQKTGSATASCESNICYSDICSNPAAMNVKGSHSSLSNSLHSSEIYDAKGFCFNNNNSDESDQMVKSVEDDVAREQAQTAVGSVLSRHSSLRTPSSSPLLPVRFSSLPPQSSYHTHSSPGYRHSFLDFPPLPVLDELTDDRKPTHFVALRVDDPTVVRNVYLFQKAILRKAPHLKPCVMNPAKLHISLLILSLRQHEVSKAINVVSQAVSEFRRCSLETHLRSCPPPNSCDTTQTPDGSRRGIFLDFTIVGTFRTRVLFTTVPKDQQKVLQALHEVLVHKVQEAGLFVVGFQDNSEPAEALQMNDRSTELLNTNSHDLNATVTVASPCDSATKNKYFTGLNTSDYAQRQNAFFNRNAHSDTSVTHGSNLQKHQTTNFRNTENPCTDETSKVHPVEETTATERMCEDNITNALSSRDHGYDPHLSRDLLRSSSSGTRGYKATTSDGAAPVVQAYECLQQKITTSPTRRPYFSTPYSKMPAFSGSAKIAQGSAPLPSPAPPVALGYFAWVPYPANTLMPAPRRTTSLPANTSGFIPNPQLIDVPSYDNYLYHLNTMRLVTPVPAGRSGTMNFQYDDRPATEYMIDSFSHNRRIMTTGCRVHSDREAAHLFHSVYANQTYPAAVHNIARAHSVGGVYPSRATESHGYAGREYNTMASNGREMAHASFNGALHQSLYPCARDSFVGPTTFTQPQLEGDATVQSGMFPAEAVNTNYCALQAQRYEENGTRPCASLATHAALDSSTRVLKCGQFPNIFSLACRPHGVPHCAQWKGHNPLPSNNVWLPSATFPLTKWPSICTCVAPSPHTSSQCCFSNAGSVPLMYNPMPIPTPAKCYTWPDEKRSSPGTAEAYWKTQHCTTHTTNAGDNDMQAIRASLSEDHEYDAAPSSKRLLALYDRSDCVGRIGSTAPFFPHMTIIKTSQGLRRIKNRRKKRMLKIHPEIFHHEAEATTSFGAQEVVVIDFLEMTRQDADGYYHRLATFPVAALTHHDP